MEYHMLQVTGPGEVVALPVLSHRKNIPPSCCAWDEAELDLAFLCPGLAGLTPLHLHSLTCQVGLMNSAGEVPSGNKACEMLCAQVSEAQEVWFMKSVCVAHTYTYIYALTRDMHT